MPVRARADALVPGGEQHVLHRAAGVEARFGRGSRRRAVAPADVRRLVDRSASCSRDLRASTTRNRHGWRFFALPASRPASRIRRTTSSGSSRSAYSPNLAPARDGEPGVHRVESYGAGLHLRGAARPRRPDGRDRATSSRSSSTTRDVTVVHWHRLREELPELQLVLYDEERDAVVGRGQTIPASTANGLPGGVDEMLERRFGPGRRKRRTCSARWSRSSIPAGRARG